MDLLTEEQVNDVSGSIDAVQTYINSLQAALIKAANAGDTGAATTIESRYEDAQLLESKLKGILTISDVDSLQAAIQAISSTTDDLKAQKEKIDAVVQDFGTAGEVLGDIVAIGTSVTKLALI